METFNSLYETYRVVMGRGKDVDIHSVIINSKEYLTQYKAILKKLKVEVSAGTYYYDFIANIPEYVINKSIAIDLTGNVTPIEVRRLIMKKGKPNPEGVYLSTMSQLEQCNTLESKIKAELESVTDKLKYDHLKMLIDANGISNKIANLNMFRKMTFQEKLQYIRSNFVGASVLPSKPDMLSMLGDKFILYTKFADTGIVVQSNVYLDWVNQKVIIENV